MQVVSALKLHLQVQSLECPTGAGPIQIKFNGYGSFKEFPKHGEETGVVNKLSPEVRQVLLCKTHSISLVPPFHLLFLTIYCSSLVPFVVPYFLPSPLPCSSHPNPGLSSPVFLYLFRNPQTLLFTTNVI